MQLQPTVSCSAEVAVRTILKWCAFWGVMKTFVSDGVPHYSNKVLKTVVENLGVAVVFSVAQNVVDQRYGGTYDYNTGGEILLGCAKQTMSPGTRVGTLGDGGVIGTQRGALRKTGYETVQMMTGRAPRTISSVMWAAGWLPAECEQDLNVTGLCLH